MERRLEEEVSGRALSNACKLILEWREEDKGH